MMSLVTHDTSESALSDRWSSSAQLWGVVALIVVGTLLRATRITESLWYDEIASWQAYCANAGSPLAIMGNFNDPINHVLSNILLWCSVRVFGTLVELEIAFRLPALFFSLLSIVVMYGLGSATRGNRTGLIAAGLMAVMPVAVLEGAEARGYSMMMCFSALATWILIDVLRRERRWWRWLAYAIVCALGVWSQFVTVFVPFSHAAWLAWRGIRRGQWRDFVQGFAALSLAGCLTLALYSPLIRPMLKSRGLFTASRPDQPRIFGDEGWHALLQLGGSWYWWAAVPGLAVGLAGLILTIRNGESKTTPRCTAGDAIAASLLGLPIMLIVIALGGTWVYARFMLFAFPGAVLLIAIGIDRLWTIHRALAWVAMILIAAASMADLRIRPPKQPLREAMDFVREHQSAGDDVLALGLAHPVSLVYATDVHLSYTMNHGAELAARLAELQPRWLVIEYPRNVSAQNFALIRDSGFDEQERFPGWADWGNGEIIVMRKR